MSVETRSKAFLNALCAGILIHLGLVDIVAVEFNDKKAQSSLPLLLLMISGLFVGTAIMAVLAIWA